MLGPRLPNEPGQQMGFGSPRRKVQCWIYIEQHMNSRRLRTAVCLRKLASDLGKWIEMVCWVNVGKRIVFTEQCRLTDGDIKWRKQKHECCSSYWHSSYPAEALQAQYIKSITLTWVFFHFSIFLQNINKWTLFCQQFGSHLFNLHFYFAQPWHRSSV